MKKELTPEQKHARYLAVKKYKQKHKDRDAAMQKTYRLKNKERLKEYHKKWLDENRDSWNAYHASRKKRVKQQTPPWADLIAIQEFYFNCPKGYHVDHIVPIKGENVSGLHTLENLQYLPAKDNLSKSNKF